MADVVDFNSFNNKSNKKHEEELYYEKQDRILEVIDEEYPLGGIVITLSEDGANMSCSIKDYSTAKNALISAMVSFLESAYNYDDQE